MEGNNVASTALGTPKDDDSRGLSNATQSSSQSGPSTSTIEKSEVDLVKKWQPLTECIPIPQPKTKEWKWVCHLCRSKYRLGVTNRCLIDGHYFCSGKPTNGVNGETKGRSCKSYLDKNGWMKRNGYRTTVRCLKGIESSPGCWEDCYYPGMCHGDSAPLDKRQNQGLNQSKKALSRKQDKKSSISVRVTNLKSALLHMSSLRPQTPTRLFL